MTGSKKNAPEVLRVPKIWFFFSGATGLSGEAEKTIRKVAWNWALRSLRVSPVISEKTSGN